MGMDKEFVANDVNDINNEFEVGLEDKLEEQEFGCPAINGQMPETD